MYFCGTFLNPAITQNPLGPFPLSTVTVQSHDLKHSRCRDIQSSLFSCEQYPDCNFPAAHFQFGCRIRDRPALPPSLSLLPADQQGNARDDDCPGFIWFKGECLFSAANRFMDFPPTDVRQRSPPSFQYVCKGHKSNLIASRYGRSAHNYRSYAANDRQRSGKGLWYKCGLDLEVIPPPAPPWNVLK